MKKVEEEREKRATSFLFRMSSELAGASGHPALAAARPTFLPSSLFSLLFPPCSLYLRDTGELPVVLTSSVQSKLISRMESELCVCV